MSYYDEWCEDERVEQEPMLELDEVSEIKAELMINEGVIIAAIDKVMNERVRDTLKNYIEKETNNFFNNHYQSKIKFEDLMYKILKEKFDGKYPDTVENKVNELEEEIKKMKISSRNSTYQMENFCKKATDRIKQHEKLASEKVSAYIESELSEKVSKSTEYIEQFSKNYFAKNLFRAMGMMDKMLPQTESNNQN